MRVHYVGENSLSMKARHFDLPLEYPTERCWRSYVIPFPRDHAADRSAWESDDGVAVHGCEAPWRIICLTMDGKPRYFLRDEFGETEPIPYGYFSQVVYYASVDDYKKNLGGLEYEAHRLCVVIEGLEANTSEMERNHKGSVHPDIFLSLERARKYISEALVTENLQFWLHERRSILDAATSCISDVERRLR